MSVGTSKRSGAERQRGPAERARNRSESGRSQPVGELWQYRALIGNFAARELKSRYKRSVLGWFWSLLNPAATLGVYVLVFGFFLRFAPPTAGNGKLHLFALYLFTALIAWNFFFAVVTGSMGALVSAGPLLKKIYFPPFAPVAGNVLAVLNQTAIETGIAIVIFAALFNISWTALFVPLLLVLLTLFSLGLGLMLSLFNVRYRDVNYLVTIALNLLFYTAPIIYPITFVRDHLRRCEFQGKTLSVAGLPAGAGCSTPPHWVSHGHLVWVLYNLNPVTAFVQAYREALWDLSVPNIARLGYLVGISVVMFVLGWHVFNRGARDVSEEL